MSIIQSYLFDNPIDFVLNNTQIESGTAKLGFLADPNLTFSETFDSGTGFTYDNTKAEFIGGLVRQIDKRPSNSLLGSTFTSSKNSSWTSGTGVLTAVDVGSPILSGGLLVCSGGNNGIYYQGSEIGSIGNIGTVKFKYRPSYSGTPAQNNGAIYLGDPANLTGLNQLLLIHSASGGTWRITARDSSNISVYSAQIIGAAWSPVAGQTYEIELVLDTQVSGIKLFINGVLHGTLGTTFTRTNTATRMYIGSNPTYLPALADFDDVVAFSDIQHTVGYVAGYSLPEYAFLESKVDGPNLVYSGLGDILSIDFASTIEVGSPRYILDGKYWNGAAWVASNDSYAQSTPFSVAAANFGSFALTGGILTWSVVFPDSNSLSSVSEFYVEYTGQKYSLTGYIEPATGIYVASILGFLQDSTSPIGTSVGVCLKINGILKYWDGSAWVTSNGTIAQTNTYLEINDNLGSLVLNENSNITPRWVLDSNSELLTPSVDTASIVYNFGGLDSPADTCLVYGYIKNLSGNPVSGATLTFSLNSANTSYSEAASNVISTKSVKAKTNVNGFFSLDLIRSSEFETAVNYKVTIDLKDRVVVSKLAGNAILFNVPDLDVQDITSLLPII